MRKLTKREKSILVLCILTIFIYFLKGNLLDPFLGELKRIDQKILETRAQIAKRKRIIQKSRYINQKYQHFFEKYQQKQSNEEIMSSMVSSIEEVAKKLEIPITDLKPGRVKESDFFNIFSVSLRINSNFPLIVQFIYFLQKAPYDFNVSEIQFIESLNRGDEGEVITRLVLSKTLIR